MSTATANAPTEADISTDRMFQILCQQLQKKPDGHKKVMAHLRAVRGRAITLPNYHNDTTIAEEDKRVLYQACVKALLNNDYTALQGQSAKDNEEPRIDPVAEVQKKEAQSATTQAAPLTRETITPKPKTVNTKQGSTSTDSALVEMLVGLLLPALEPRIQAMVEERLVSCVNTVSESVTAKFQNGHFPTDRVKEIVNTVLKERFS